LDIKAILESRCDQEISIEIYANIVIMNKQYSSVARNKFSWQSIDEWLKSEKELQSEFTSANIYSLITYFFNKIKEIEIEKLKPILNIFERGIKEYEKEIYLRAKKDYEPITERFKDLNEIIEKTSKISKGNLDINWAKSALILTLLENLVKLKLKELGEQTGGDFRTLVSRLGNVLINKEN